MWLCAIFSVTILWSWDALRDVAREDRNHVFRMSQALVVVASVAYVTCIAGLYKTLHSYINLIAGTMLMLTTCMDVVAVGAMHDTHVRAAFATQCVTGVVILSMKIKEFTI